MPGSKKSKSGSTSTSKSKEDAAKARKKAKDKAKKNFIKRKQQLQKRKQYSQSTSVNRRQRGQLAITSVLERTYVAEPDQCIVMFLDRAVAREGDEFLLYSYPHDPDTARWLQIRGVWSAIDGAMEALTNDDLQIAVFTDECLVDPTEKSSSSTASGGGGGKDGDKDKDVIPVTSNSAKKSDGGVKHRVQACMMTIVPDELDFVMLHLTPLYDANDSFVEQYPSARSTNAPRQFAPPLPDEILVHRTHAFLAMYRFMFGPIGLYHFRQKHARPLKTNNDIGACMQPIMSSELDDMCADMFPILFPNTVPASPAQATSTRDIYHPIALLQHSFSPSAVFGTNDMTHVRNAGKLARDFIQGQNLTYKSHTDGAGGTTNAAGTVHGGDSSQSGHSNRHGSGHGSTLFKQGTGIAAMVDGITSASTTNTQMTLHDQPLNNRTQANQVYLAFPPLWHPIITTPYKIPNANEEKKGDDDIDLNDAGKSAELALDDDYDEDGEYDEDRQMNNPRSRGLAFRDIYKKVVAKSHEPTPVKVKRTRRDAYGNEVEISSDSEDENKDGDDDGRQKNYKVFADENTLHNTISQDVAAFLTLIAIHEMPGEDHSAAMPWIQELRDQTPILMDHAKRVAQAAATNTTATSTATVVPSTGDTSGISASAAQQQAANDLLHSSTKLTHDSVLTASQAHQLKNVLAGLSSSVISAANAPEHAVAVVLMFQGYIVHVTPSTYGTASFAASTFSEIQTYIRFLGLHTRQSTSPPYTGAFDVYSPATNTRVYKPRSTNADQIRIVKEGEAEEQHPMSFLRKLLVLCHGDVTLCILLNPYLVGPYLHADLKHIIPVCKAAGRSILPRIYDKLHQHPVARILRMEQQELMRRRDHQLGGSMNGGMNRNNVGGAPPVMDGGTQLSVIHASVQDSVVLVSPHHPSHRQGNAHSSTFAGSANQSGSRNPYHQASSMTYNRHISQTYDGESRTILSHNHLSHGHQHHYEDSRTRTTAPGERLVAENGEVVMETGVLADGEVAAVIAAPGTTTTTTGGEMAVVVADPNQDQALGGIGFSAFGWNGLFGGHNRSPVHVLFSAGYRGLVLHSEWLRHLLRGSGCSASETVYNATELMAMGHSQAKHSQLIHACGRVHRMLCQAKMTARSVSELTMPSPNSWFAAEANKKLMESLGKDKDDIGFKSGGSGGSSSRHGGGGGGSSSSSSSGGDGDGTKGVKGQMRWGASGTRYNADDLSAIEKCYLRLEEQAKQRSAACLRMGVLPPRYTINDLYVRDAVESQHTRLIAERGVRLVVTYAATSQQPQAVTGMSQNNSDFSTSQRPTSTHTRTAREQHGTQMGDDDDGNASTAYWVIGRLYAHPQGAVEVYVYYREDETKGIINSQVFEYDENIGGPRPRLGDIAKYYDDSDDDEDRSENERFLEKAFANVLAQYALVVN